MPRTATSLRLAAALAVCVAALVPAPSATRAVPLVSRCIGRWQGTGVQPGLPPWSIDMVVTKESGSDCGTIEYPSLRCGGVLSSCEQRGGTVHFVERYTHNDAHQCAPAGVIDAVCVGHTMAWTWSGEEVVHSLLHRM